MNKQKIERETVRLFETIRPVRSFKMIPSLFQKIAEVNSNLFFESEKKSKVSFNNHAKFQVLGYVVVIDYPNNFTKNKTKHR